MREEVAADVHGVLGRGALGVAADGHHRTLRVELEDERVREASSELLSSICDALDVPMSLVLREVSDRIAVAEGLLIPDTVPVDLAAAVAGRSWDGRSWESSRGELAPVG